MKNQALWMRLRDEEWQNYAVSQGDASRLEKVLQDLASRKRARSMKACHEVWKLLCSGGVHSAAVITVPYLVEILKISTEDVQMEIADVIKSCALGVGEIEEDWGISLKQVLRDQEFELKRLQKNAKGDTCIALDAAIDAVRTVA
jgi:hypothetical protein